MRRVWLALCVVWSAGVMAADPRWIDVALLPPLPPRPAAMPYGTTDPADEQRLVQAASDRAGVYQMRLLASERPAFRGDGYEVWWRPLAGEPRLLHTAACHYGERSGAYLDPELAVSPDGRWVAWSAQIASDTVILAAARDGAAARQLAKAPVETMVDYPGFTADSRAVTYLRWRGRRAERAGEVEHSLRQVGLDGQGDRELLAEASPAYAFSPDGRQLAYAVRGQLHRRDLVSGADAVVTDSVWHAFHGLAWSPDGTHLAYSGASRAAAPDRDRRGGQDEAARSALWAVPAAGGQARELTLDEGCFGWLADSAHLLCGDRIVALDGQQTPARATVPHRFVDVRWQPDSRGLLAIADTSTALDPMPGVGRWQAVELGLDGTLRTLPEEGVWAALPTAAGLLTLRGEHGGWLGVGSATLALDGRALHTGTNLRSLSASADGRRVAVVQGLPGSAQVLVGPPFAPVPGLPSDVEVVSLSPDGRRLALVTASRRAMVAGVDGSERVEVTDAAWHVAAPSWQPDSRRWRLSERRDAAYDLAGLRVAPPKPTLISLPALPGERDEDGAINTDDVLLLPALASPDGRWLAVVHRGAIWLCAADDEDGPARQLADDGVPTAPLLPWPALPTADGSRP